MLCAGVRHVASHRYVAYLIAKRPLCTQRMAAAGHAQGKKATTAAVLACPDHRPDPYNINSSTPATRATYGFPCSLTCFCVIASTIGKLYGLLTMPYRPPPSTLCVRFRQLCAHSRLPFNFIQCYQFGNRRLASLTSSPPAATPPTPDPTSLRRRRLPSSTRSSRGGSATASTAARCRRRRRPPSASRPRPQRFPARAPTP